MGPCWWGWGCRPGKGEAPSWRVGARRGDAVQAACADADCVNEVQAAAEVARRVWDLPPLQRGQMLHRLFGQNLPERFPVVDYWVPEEGRVVSLKTLDLGAQRYQDLNQLRQAVQEYIKKLAEFRGASYGKEAEQAIIRAQDIKIRELWLVISGGNEKQWELLHALKQFAAERNVMLKIILEVTR